MKHILTIENFINEASNKKVLYHGSFDEEINELTPHSWETSTRKSPNSIYLSSSKRVARDYGYMIYKCVLDMSNANYTEVDFDGRSYHDDASYDDYIQEAYEEGYDFIIVRNIRDSKEPKTNFPISDVYVVFNEKLLNIISVENCLLKK